jgi:hypothetical protein
MLTKLKHWLSSLFCIHQWDIYEEHIISVYDTWGFETDEELRLKMKRPPSYHLKKIILRCKKCGDLKSRVFKF